MASVPLVGRTVGRWRCLSKLGTGSFGIVHVWESESGEGGKRERVAIKQCRFGPDVLLSSKVTENTCVT